MEEPVSSVSDTLVLQLHYVFMTYGSLEKDLVDIETRWSQITGSHPVVCSKGCADPGEMTSNFVKGISIQALHFQESMTFCRHANSLPLQTMVSAGQKIIFSKQFLSFSLIQQELNCVKLDPASGPAPVPQHPQMRVFLQDSLCSAVVRIQPGCTRAMEPHCASPVWITRTAPKGLLLAERLNAQVIIISSSIFHS